MAEVAASITGLVAFGAQTLQAVIEAQRLIASIRSVPADVENLLEEIKHLQDLLSSLNQQHEEFAIHASPSPVWKESLRRCNGAATALSQTASEIRDQLRKSRLRGTFKALSSKDAIDKWQKRLSNAKGDLLLAQSCFTATIQRQQLSQGLRITRMLELFAQEERVAVDGRSDSDSIVVVQNQKMAKQHEQHDRRTRCTHKDDQFLEFTLGHRWLRKLLTIRLNMAPNTFGIQIMQQNVVPYSAAIMRAAGDHDSQKLIDLLTTRQASIYDIDEYGQHPIELAIAVTDATEASVHSFTRFANVLLHAGLRLDSSSIRRLLLDSCGNTKGAWSDSAVAALASFLISNCRNTSIILPQTPKWSWTPYSAQNSTAALQMLLGSLDLTYQDLPFSERWHYAIRETYSNPEVFYSYLGQRRIDESCLQSWTDVDWHVSNEIDHFAPKTLLAKVARSTSYRSNLDGWQQLLKLAGDIGGYEVACASGESPLFTYVTDRILYAYSKVCSMQSWEAFVEASLKEWLEMVSRAKQDLRIVGRSEWKLLQRAEPQLLRFPAHGWGVWATVVGLSYGPSIEDWKIWLGTPLDEYAGELWQLFEGPLCQDIPGSWMDEDEELFRQQRAEPGSFESLATSRRKRRRYLRMMEWTACEAQQCLGLPGHICRS